MGSHVIDGLVNWYNLGGQFDSTYQNVRYAHIFSYQQQYLQSKKQKQCFPLRKWLIKLNYPLQLFKNNEVNLYILKGRISMLWCSIKKKNRIVCIVKSCLYKIQTKSVWVQTHSTFINFGRPQAMLHGQWLLSEWGG